MKLTTTFDWPRRLLASIIAAGLMAGPVIVLRWLEGADWDPGDAVFLAVLASLLALAFELAGRTSPGRAYTAGAALALAAALLQAWINLAVGVLGSEDNPANAIYAAVVAVALAGALLARFRPRGMALAMLAGVAAQITAFALAWAAGWGFTGPITVFFAGLWLAAAALFDKSARAARTA